MTMTIAKAACFFVIAFAVAAVGGCCGAGAGHAQGSSAVAPNPAPDWIAFFTSTFDAIHEPLAVVLSAPTCRKGWILGEMYRAGRQRNLRIDEYAVGDLGTADISCGQTPDMLAEVRIAGAAPGLKLHENMELLGQQMRTIGTPATQRFMILIIPHSQDDAEAEKYLRPFSFARESVDHDWPDFRVRIWRF